MEHMFDGCIELRFNRQLVGNVEWQPILLTYMYFTCNTFGVLSV